MKDTTGPIQLLGILPPFHLFTLVGEDPNNLKIVHLATVTPSDLLPQFVVPQGAPMSGADSGKLVMEWGRCAALQEHCKEQAERQLRTWKATRVQERWDEHEAALTAWEARPNKGKDDKPPKAPTEAAIEASYRIHPEYAGVQALVEATKEATRVSLNMLSAAEAKKSDLASLSRMMSSGA